ncbi:hypothetical protein [Diaphorobacter aerolatus]|uniref:Transposase n=1 Tax=Diaphorobacter aerolatus TaxID=1288495 RepID=A0A7H0GJD0_9BURK|nr:hypothetical protein [Diaphorobacter aerolatus]QNP48396.1 hypothetical protein H9K75_20975 [Diaphorobacter aerolatus]
MKNKGYKVQIDAAVIELFKEGKPFKAKDIAERAGVDTNNVYQTPSAQFAMKVNKYVAADRSQFLRKEIAISNLQNELVKIQKYEELVKVSNLHIEAYKREVVESFIVLYMKLN